MKDKNINLPRHWHHDGFVLHHSPRSDSRPFLPQVNVFQSGGSSLQFAVELLYLKNTSNLLRILLLNCDYRDWRTFSLLKSHSSVWRKNRFWELCTFWVWNWSRWTCSSWSISTFCKTLTRVDDRQTFAVPFSLIFSEDRRVSVNKRLEIIR